MLIYENFTASASPQSYIDMDINYASMPTPPSSNEDSPGTMYFVASPNPDSLTSPEITTTQQPVSLISQIEYNMHVMDMTTVATGTTGAPFLNLVEQPTDKFRFRYRSEMAGTHGSLTGMNSDKSRKQTYPTVELVNFNKKATIRCSIYQINHAKRDFMPHAHRLIMKRGKEEYDDPHDLTVGPEEGYTATFHSMGIIHTAKKNIQSELIRKKAKLKKEFIARMEHKHRELTTKENIEIKGLAESESKSINLNIVCLRFDAFYVDNGIFYPLCPPVYSHGINNLKSALTGELKIVRMDHCTSPAKGGREVFVFVERVTKKNIKIRFFELDDEDKEVWEDWGKFTDLDVHHQYAIAFKTPKYQNDKITSPVKVFMELVRPSDSARSEPKEFTYTPSDYFKPGTKRPRTNSYSSSYNSSSLSSSELPAIINTMNTAASLNVNSFDIGRDNCDLITSEELFRACEDIDSEEFKRLCSGFLNEHSESYNTASDEHVNTGVDAPVGFQTRRYLESQLLRLKNMRLTNQNLTLSSQPISRNVPSVQSTRAVVKMEPSYEDTSIAQRTYNELRSFLKTKYTPEKALEMLHHYLKEEGKNNALHTFVSQNKIEEVQFILDVLHKYHQCDLVNVKNSEYYTSLHIATICNNKRLIKCLLKCNADVSTRDSNGNTAIHIAINHSLPLDILETLLTAKGAKKCIDAEDNEGNTPLVNAVEKGNLFAIKLLCSNGVNINQRHNKNGFTPVRFAIEKQNLDVIKFIMNHPDLRLDMQNDFSDISPFKAAHLKGVSKDIIEYIQSFMEKKHIEIDFKQEVDDDSDREMEEEDCEIKSFTIPADELEEWYKNVTKFTPECLEELNRLLESNGKWEDLADLLDLSHILRCGVIPVDQNIAKNLLIYAVERNNDKILEIRNFLENLDENKAVEVIDRMVLELNQ